LTRFIFNILHWARDARPYDIMLKRLLIGLLCLVLTFGTAPAAWAFCGFYVAKADTKLYNQASQVVIARDGDRTILTMANDFQGEVKDFAIVVPVPTVLEEGQVHVAEPGILERLDSFSAPRLVEYFDENPCEPVRRYEMQRAGGPRPVMAPAPAAARPAADLGVTIESKFTVGEYDILVLSAKESSGLETWLRQNDYKLPRGADALLQPYIRQNLKFFVAKVNLKEFAKTGVQNLRPIQIAYESKKFMLPIRLGMMNAQGEQDLIAYLLSPKGRIELTNYRSVNVPSDAEVPEQIKSDFANFYKSMFKTAHQKEDRRVAFVEYAWNMASCDPCSADPLSPDELRKAGVFWLDDGSSNNGGFVSPKQSRFVPSRPPRPIPSGNGTVFITRMHVRYSRDRFPEDLMFQETSNQQFFQGRYVVRHPFKGATTCEAGRQYQRGLGERFEKEAKTLANLTGWNINDIRRKLPPTIKSQDSSWWRRMWTKAFSANPQPIEPIVQSWWKGLWDG
jgi:hypothetical protein